MIFDVSLKNDALYAGCEITEVSGAKNLITPPATAKEIIGKNAAAILDAVPANQREEITLTGGMAVWAYLVVGHYAFHRFKSVRYADGKGNDIEICRHG